ncbi:MAG: glycoside hydrolase family 27 protein [Lachnospiraceae bacterium]|nr:glycoside hydrolase family 27 protein [Lachnospiraceae bacterium]
MDKKNMLRKKTKPDEINDNKYRFDSFNNTKVLSNKKKNHLPAMGWNSWNAFGSGNTEKLTKEMADKIIELELDKLGYQYIVLDDGCYKSERVDGHLSNETDKFPSGFKTLSDYIHNKGLKFGMYNDIGTNLCAGAAVGTCGYEDIDAQSYIDWDIDYIKVDNCYYLWDNATFSDEKNAKYVYAPKIRKIKLINELGDCYSLSASKDGYIYGNGPYITEDCCVNIGTLDGTGPKESPNSLTSGELRFDTDIEKEGEYHIIVEYATAEKVEVGSWIQIGVINDKLNQVLFDNEVPNSENEDTFIERDLAKVLLCKGKNTIRIMNHRRQENTLLSYNTFLENLNIAKPNHDIIFSICEWGKTQPQTWGYKVGDSWRILNDITFQVGADGDYGVGAWSSDYTPGIATQYNKAVIMDEYAGLDKGWNDPDMLIIGMNNITNTMAKSHMSMWCMMNSPLMLGLDLRRVNKNDEIYNIIANKDLILFNQDKLGIQAKRIYCSIIKENCDKEYVTDNNRVDIVVKPLFDGGVAIAFYNLSGETKRGEFFVSVEQIINGIGKKMINSVDFMNANCYSIYDVWSKETKIINENEFVVNEIEPYGNITIKVMAK